jgi:hypothetical protein
VLVFSSLVIYYDVRDNGFCCLVLECCAFLVFGDLVGTYAGKLFLPANV